MNLKDSLPLTYAPKDLSSYKIDNGQWYLSRKINIDGNETDVFLELAVKGKLDLYIYSYSGGEDKFFVSKNDTDLVELKNTTSRVNVNGIQDIKEHSEYINTLSVLLSDCPKISQSVYSCSLNYSNLIALSSKYHSLVCNGEKCEIFTRKTKKPRISIEQRSV